MKQSKYKKGQVWLINGDRVRIQKVYPPGHKYGAEIGSNAFFYLVWSDECGQDVWNEHVLSQMIAESGELMPPAPKYQPVTATNQQQILELITEIEQQ